MHAILCDQDDIAIDTEKWFIEVRVRPDHFDEPLHFHGWGCLESYALAQTAKAS